MGDDIVARLRDQAQAPALAWLTDAADEIERLRAIERYAEHRDCCEQPDTASRVCPCGLTELLEARRG